VAFGLMIDAGVLSVRRGKKKDEHREIAGNYGSQQRGS
jgi:hypothetical protein